MPKTRKADYHLGCLNGSVFIDFNNYKSNYICLKRISFDGYGCCNIGEEVIAINEINSLDFKSMIFSNNIDQSKLSSIIKDTVKENKDLIWEDALLEYGFL